jgi:hypothetical protein
MTCTTALRALREACGLSEERTALLTGISVARYRQMETETEHAAYPERCCIASVLSSGAAISEVPGAAPSTTSTGTSPGSAHPRTTT